MATELLNTLSRINKEFGITIILSEHRLNEVFEISDKFIAMDNGYIVCDGTPKEVANKLYKEKSELFTLLPELVRLSLEITKGKWLACDVTEGKKLISSMNMNIKKGRFTEDKLYDENSVEFVYNDSIFSQVQMEFLIDNIKRYPEDLIISAFGWSDSDYPNWGDLSEEWNVILWKKIYENR
jgi:ABC-type multidrug transport system ATPase subunit